MATPALQATMSAADGGHRINNAYADEATAAEMRHAFPSAVILLMRRAKHEPANLALAANHGYSSSSIASHSS